jgi:hypothetical protein
MYNHKEVLLAELDSGENLLWSGRPRQGIFLRGSDAFMIPFSLMWGGFAIFWEFSVITGDAPFFFMLWGIPFVLIGLYFIFGRFIVDSKQREKTFYGVTDKRVIILSGLFSKKANSLAIRLLSDISLKEKSDGSGTVVLGQENPMEAMYSGMAWPGMKKTTPRLESIQEAKKVYNTIREIRENHT